MKGAKRLHIAGVEWQYKVGQKNVLIVPPTGKKLVVDFETLFGQRRWQQLNNYLEDDYCTVTRVAILPSDVKTYIESTLRGNGHR